MIEEKFAEIIRAFVANLYSNSGAVSAGFQLSFKGPDEITDFFIVNVQITVSRHPELVAAVYVETREQPLDMDPND